MDPDHYDIFYLNNTFSTPATQSNSVDNYIIHSLDNSTIPSVGPDSSSKNMRINPSMIPLLVPNPSSDSMGGAKSVTSNVDGSLDDAIPKNLHTRLPNLSYRNIRQQIWSSIFKYKQDPKYLKRYNGNKNHWRKVKYNWSAAISTLQ